MSSVDVSQLKSLGSGSTEYKYEGADATLLESFDNPAFKHDLNPTRSNLTVSIVAPEFTSLCPLTGQPDFATIKVNYLPRNKCVESKSFKLYLGSFRNFGEFHESCVNRIANDLVKLLDPEELTVIGEFTPRGGIAFHPTATYIRSVAPISSKIEVQA